MPAPLSRYLCTATAPYTREEHGRYAQHPDAREVGAPRDGWPGGDLQDYQCPYCQQRWTEELPQ